MGSFPVFISMRTPWLLLLPPVCSQRYIPIAEIRRMCLEGAGSSVMKYEHFSKLGSLDRLAPHFSCRGSQTTAYRSSFMQL
ncbi:hypothetical protein B0O80DRAFT_447470 [Mortierella sp. GBAus27b]|nr:hypothetical protein B0O80DRAFT_447470 [Mortierella sp. GBAus27b]